MTSNSSQHNIPELEASLLALFFRSVSHPASPSRFFRIQRKMVEFWSVETGPKYNMKWHHNVARAIERL